MTAVPVLSVVVPFHDSVQYFGPLLRSLEAQIYADLEIICVDDGSQVEAPARLVSSYAEKDPRFRLVRQENAGAGGARNFGIAHATGEYLAFADSDDLVPPRAYQALVGALERSGSDLAAGAATRFSSLGMAPSVVHEAAFRVNEPATHLRQRPELVLDRMIWNKVYRRSFWDAAGLGFRRMRLEDYPLSLEAHTKAAAIDVMTQRVYHWRERDGGEPSGTQGSAAFRHVSDRVRSAKLVLDLIARETPGALPLLARHLFDNDVHTVVAALDPNDDELRPQILALARDLLAAVEDHLPAELPPFSKVEAELVRRGDIATLIELDRFARRSGRNALLTRVGDFFVEALPGRGPLPDNLYAAEPTFEVAVGNVGWSGSVVDVELELRSTLPLGEAAGVTVEIQAPTGESTALSTQVGDRRGIDGVEVTAVRTSADVRALLAKQPRPGGFWGLRVNVADSALGSEVSRPVAITSSGSGRYPAGRMIAGTRGLLVRPWQKPDAGFGLFMRRVPAAASASRPEGDGIRIDGWIRGQLEPDQEVLVWVVGPLGRVECRARTAPREGNRTSFSALLPAEGLIGAPGPLSPLAAQDNRRVVLSVGGEVGWLPVGDGFTAEPYVAGERSLVATTDAMGVLTAVESRVAATITAVRWIGESTLAFEAYWRGEEPLPDVVEVRRPSRAHEWVEERCPLERVSPTSYRFGVDVARLVALQEQQQREEVVRTSGLWHLLLPFAELHMPHTFDRTALARFASPRTVAGRRVTLMCVRDDVVRIGIG